MMNLHEYGFAHIGQKISDFFNGIADPKERNFSELGDIYHLSDFLP